MSIGEQLVSHQSNTYAYMAYIENQLTYSSSEKKTKLALCHYHRDKGIAMNDFKGDTNTGFQERAKAIAESKSLTMRGCLHNEFLRQDRYLISHCSLRIRLTPHTKDFVLMTDKIEDYALKIVDAKLEVPKLKLKPSLSI